MYRYGDLVDLIRSQIGQQATARNSIMGSIIVTGMYNTPISNSNDYMYKLKFKLDSYIPVECRTWPSDQNVELLMIDVPYVVVC